MLQDVIIPEGLISIIDGPVQSYSSSFRSRLVYRCLNQILLSSVICLADMCAHVSVIKL